MECMNTSTHGLSERSSTHSIRDRHDRSRFPAVTVPSSPAAVWVSWDRSPGTFRPCRATGGLPDISPKKHTRICLLFMAHPTSVNDFLPGLCSSQRVPTPYLYQAGIRPDAPLTGLTCSSPLQHGNNRTPGSPHRPWLKPDRGGSAPPSLQRADQVGANTPHTRGDSTYCPDAGTPDGVYYPAPDRPDTPASPQLPDPALRAEPPTHAVPATSSPMARHRAGCHPMPLPGADGPRQSSRKISG